MLLQHSTGGGGQWLALIPHVWNLMNLNQLTNEQNRK